MNPIAAINPPTNVSRTSGVRLLLCVFFAWLIWAQATIATAENYALLVGVNKYDDSDLLGPLKYTENDVNDLGRILREDGYAQVVLMTQAAGKSDQRLIPSAENIRQQLAALLANRQKEDLVIVAFSGHGLQIRGEDDSFFCPQDFNASKRDTMLSLNDIYLQLGKCNAGAKILLVDACRDKFEPSNSKSVQATKLEPVGQVNSPKGGILAIFSCSEDERSFENDELNHGVFFYHIIEGLKKDADSDNDKKVTNVELSGHLVSKVVAYSTTKQRNIQTPAVKADFGGLVTLVRVRPSLKQPAPPPSTTEKPRSLRNSLGMQFILINPGTFLMGSPSQEKGRSPDEVQHQVRISEPFYLGILEVTQDQYAEVMETNPSYFSNIGSGKDKVRAFKTTTFPVESVSWEDANKFCQKLSNRPEEAGRTYRLPTEAEWEYACRAGTTSAFSGSEDLSITQANFKCTSPNLAKPPGIFLNATSAGGTGRDANAWGLYDMHGNVWEWCSDGYGEYGASSLTDPRGSRAAKARVARGGAWYFDASGCRSAARMHLTPTYKGFDGGFRVVLTFEK